MHWVYFLTLMFPLRFSLGVLEIFSVGYHSTFIIAVLCPISFLLLCNIEFADSKMESFITWYGQGNANSLATPCWLEASHRSHPLSEGKGFHKDVNRDPKSLPVSLTATHAVTIVALLTCCQSHWEVSALQRGTAHTYLPQSNTCKKYSVLMDKWAR